ncbi:trehalose-phosphatase [Marinimicrobium sp. ABcell2]|uniref:trehalose-phosphatase n=1 Tax=Marinimicrobium sp. ABcell2 TaxID=3069751 RepID=UPI0027B633A0|nr:trehalose-phosphatase [Marinimicrobium sp. ABcell2]MDQ2077826.1 trehalose-phosphatase [Marinimicrobium sp. ABcell2]
MNRTCMPYEAYIFDLDGVLTRTADLHFSAWKTLFDDFLSQRKEKAYSGFSEADYQRYVNGKPRLDGVRDFLTARGIVLDLGTSEDGPDQETICGLGNRKNQLFHEQMQHHGVATYSEAIKFLRTVRDKGGRTAAVSSSKNAQSVLKNAGIETLFDARVDGEMGEQLKLPGKPAPDYFVEAARRLQIKPEQCVVFEDAIAGVEAARRGGFGLVVGVARETDPVALSEAGADVVVEELTQLPIECLPRRHLPLALDEFPRLAKRLNRRVCVALDYDGTLTPIVADPEDAILSEDMRERLVQLARCCPVAIVSGRDVNNVRQLVQLPQLYYVGSHGFDINGSDTDPLQHQTAQEFLPALDAAESDLRERLRNIEGAQLERKRFSLAVHYRNVAAPDRERIDQVVNQVAQEYRELRRTTGKKVIELRPGVDWDKGKAVHWLLQRLQRNDLQLYGKSARVLYIGDDVTDEDVFRSIIDEGVGVVVADAERVSLAHFRLRNPDEVAQFLGQLTHALK